MAKEKLTQSMYAGTLDVPDSEQGRANLMGFFYGLLWSCNDPQYVPFYERMFQLFAESLPRALVAEIVPGLEEEIEKRSGRINELAKQLARQMYHMPPDDPQEPSKSKP